MAPSLSKTGFSDLNQRPTDGPNSHKSGAVVGGLAVGRVNAYQYLQPAAVVCLIELNEAKGRIENRELVGFASSHKPTGRQVTTRPRSVARSRSTLVAYGLMGAFVVVRRRSGRFHGYPQNGTAGVKVLLA